MKYIMSTYCLNVVTYEIQESLVSYVSKHGCVAFNVVWPGQVSWVVAVHALFLSVRTTCGARCDLAAHTSWCSTPWKFPPPAKIVNASTDELGCVLIFLVIRT